MCHVPAPYSELNGGFECNGPCIDGNREHSDIYSAWERCAVVTECTMVLKFSPGRFFLRKADDPPTGDQSQNYFNYCDKSSIFSFVVILATTRRYRNGAAH